MGEADAARSQGHFQRALDILAAVKRQNPATPGLDQRLYQSHMEYAKVLLDQNSLEAADAQYGEALRLRQGDTAARDGQGQVILKRDWNEVERVWPTDDEAAIVVLERIFARAADYRGGEARRNLYAKLIGKFDRLRASNRDEACRTLTRAADVNPSGAEVGPRRAACTPTPTPPPPTATPTPPPPTATPTPTRPPTATPTIVRFVSVVGGLPGGRASVTVETAPGASCLISYVTPAGTTSIAEGLVPKTADANGRAPWSWNIGPNTRPGTGRVTVTCNGVSASTPIQIG